MGVGSLSLLSEAYSKLILGYCLHPLLTREAALKALDRALGHESVGRELLHPSDRGSPYSRFPDGHQRRQAGLAIRRTEDGDPYEHALAERVNGLLKLDFRLNRVFSTFEEAQRAVEASSTNDKHLRPHRSCGYLTPAAAHASTVAATLEAQSVPLT